MTWEKLQQYLKYMYISQITYKIIWRQNDTNHFADLACGFETMDQNVNVHANYCGQLSYTLLSFTFEGFLNNSITLRWQRAGLACPVSPVVMRRARRWWHRKKLVRLANHFDWCRTSQGSYRSWKTWKVMEFKHFIS